MDSVLKNKIKDLQLNNTQSQLPPPPPSPSPLTFAQALLQQQQNEDIVAKLDSGATANYSREIDTTAMHNIHPIGSGPTINFPNGNTAKVK